MEILSNNLYEKLKKKAHLMGADLFGVANLEKATIYIKDNYSLEYSKYPTAVSLGVFFPKEIIRLLEDGPQQVYSYYYSVINHKLDEISLLLANHLERMGYKVFPIPASQQLITNKYKGIFSHKLAASLAGLGWIGKSCCLINEQVGPRLRLATVLTNAPLKPDSPTKNKCGSCTACVKACIPGAIKGVAFKPDDPLSKRFDPKACDDYFDYVQSRHGIGNCGKCIAACPWGRE
ncbi:MAG: 4Fe-4S double cluster binding domain-containing protein [Bacillota bacterium]